MLETSEDRVGLPGLCLDADVAEVPGAGLEGDLLLVRDGGGGGRPPARGNFALVILRQHPGGFHPGRLAFLMKRKLQISNRGDRS